MVTRQLQVERRTGKVRRPETDVLPLSHATNEMWCYRRALGIPYVDHVANVDVQERVNQLRLLLGKTQSHKLRYFGHIARHPSPRLLGQLGQLSLASLRGRLIEYQLRLG